jgi:hypothetical protein
MSASVVHAYGVVPAGAAETGDPGTLPGVGIGGTSVRLLRLGSLSVVVGDLDAARFGEAAWREHGEDPAWLEPVARGHHEVLQAVAARTDVLPLRLPGIYADDDALTHALGRAEQRLLERLGFVAGHDEWGVQVFGGSRPPEERPPAGSGREYLQRRRQEVDDRDRAREDQQRLLVDVYETLTEVATSSVLNRPQDRALSGRAEPMLLNTAHLVARAAREQFFAHLDRLSRDLLEPEGMVVEVTGPWPPYNFATPAETAAGSAP